MPDNKPKPSRKPVTPAGRSLRWTEADTDRLSQITEEDKAAGKAFFRRTAPRKLKKLLDARPKGKAGE